MRARFEERPELNGLKNPVKKKTIVKRRVELSARKGRRWMAEDLIHEPNRPRDVIDATIPSAVVHEGHWYDSAVPSEPASLLASSASMLACVRQRGAALLVTAWRIAAVAITEDALPAVRAHRRRSASFPSARPSFMPSLSFRLRRRSNGGITMWRRVILCAILMPTVSCGANHNSIYRAESISGREAIISYDAKQRMMIRQVRNNSNRHNNTGDQSPQNSHHHYVVCAEPSPDAFTVLAAAAGANVDVYDKAAAAISGSQTETGAQIGLRTHSIQLLRDVGYRICEAYASGGITEFDYATLMRRFQNLLVSVLAIEQLTGAVAAPAVAIGASTGVETADALAKLQTQIEAQRARVKAAEASVATARNAVNQAEQDLNNSDKADEAAVKRAQDALNTKKAELAALELSLAEEEKDAEALKDARNRARAPNVHLTSTTTFGANQVDRERQMEKVVLAVTEVVGMMLEKSNLVDFCMLVWQRRWIDNGQVPDIQIVRRCDDVVEKFLVMASSAPNPGRILQGPMRSWPG